MTFTTPEMQAPHPAPAAGPLRVCEANPRYFAGPDGRPIYLTGAHTWCNFKDMGESDPPAPFDFPAYLDFLTRRHHNFFRFWAWEQTQFQEREGDLLYVSPFPWPRTGPGKARDGKPKFDLSRFDQSYFDRMLQRVRAAGARGIYASIMLFEGWELQFVLAPWTVDAHPFHRDNNLNGTDGDPENTGKGKAINTLAIPAITRVQEAYVRKVVDTVNDLDNVLYEICNEAGPYSTKWQYHMIRFVKSYQSAKAKQHPVGMTFQYEGGSNQTLFDSPADWISPNAEAGEFSYTDNPPPADGRKVVLSDTDHLWGIGGNQAWVWKSFCRGHNPLFMDPYLRGDFFRERLSEPGPKWDPIRRSLGYTRRFAERMDLAHCLPSLDLASTGYCLANPGQEFQEYLEYLAYLPDGGAVTLDLTAASGQCSAEWFEPSTGRITHAPSVTGGEKRELASPFPGEAAVYVRRE